MPRTTDGGRDKVTGGPTLKASQTYPTLFGVAVRKMYCRHEDIYICMQLLCSDACSVDGVSQICSSHNILRPRRKSDLVFVAGSNLEAYVRSFVFPVAGVHMSNPKVSELRKHLLEHPRSQMRDTGLHGARSSLAIDDRSDTRSFGKYISVNEIATKA